jgi:hypothetical protein
VCDFNVTGDKDLRMTCMSSGLPVVTSDEYGMWCPHMCDRDAVIAWHKDLKGWRKSLMEHMGLTED